MNHTALITVLAALTLTACDKNPAHEPFVPPAQTTPASAPWPSVSSTASGSALPPGHPAIGSGDSAMTSTEAPDAEQTEKATVVSTINIEGFTYIEVKQHNQTRWLAAKTTKAKKGAVIEFDSGSTIEDFNSKALDRTFPSMTFVNSVTVVKGK